MSSTLHFLQSPHVLALLIAVFIFLTTILLVVKRWIGFSMTLLLLLFSLAAGLIINHQQAVQSYLNAYTSSSTSTNEDSQDAFHKQMLQAVEDLKLEVSTEKENLRLVMNQIQEIFDSMDAQKQKLQNFIDETRERFKTDYPIQHSSTIPEAHSRESLKNERMDLFCYCYLCVNH
jgi:polyhydroxyalkanoate synthesis regulator protein